ncbi:MAG TPA: hypothetical protein VI542_11445 [Candidatus Tectomicrobia bacterium]
MGCSQRNSSREILKVLADEHLKTDIEKILVAKGFKITGPFDKLDMLPYPQKQGSHLTLTPVVNVDAPAKVASQTGTGSPLFPIQQDGVFLFSGWIALVMIEPLSGEKMWIKRIEVAPMEEPFRRRYYTIQSKGKDQVRVLEDTQEQALARGLNRLYPKVMEQAWAYINPDEIMHVKQQADEVRKLKRF